MVEPGQRHAEHAQVQDARFAQGDDQQTRRNAQAKEDDGDRPALPPGQQSVHEDPFATGKRTPVPLGHRLVRAAVEVHHLTGGVLRHLDTENARDGQGKPAPGERPVGGGEEPRHGHAGERGQ